VLHSRGSLDELAVKHHCTRSPFWEGKGEKKVRGAADHNPTQHTGKPEDSCSECPQDSAQSVSYFMDREGHCDMSTLSADREEVTGGSLDTRNMGFITAGPPQTHCVEVQFHQI
jgi:hypothetical protein